MDFLWSNDPAQLSALRGAMRRVGHDDKNVALACNGPWGAVVAMKSPYQGLQPFVDKDVAVVVIGDPLISHETDSSVPASIRRTSGIFRMWRASGKDRRPILPRHPSAMLCFGPDPGTAEVITDASGAVPVFVSQPLSGSANFLASSAELIAAVVKPHLDDVSAREFILTRRVSFPNSLYHGITELLPGSIHRFPERSTSRWWQPPLPNYSEDPRVYADSVRETVYETINLLARQVVGQGVTTLSAGSDTRVVAAIASKVLNLQGITITAKPNLESRTARQVARRLGIPWRHVVRSANHYGDVYRSVPMMLGAHCLWSDAHFHLNALDLPEDVPFVLGGYQADALFRSGVALYKRRKASIARGRVEADSPLWIIDRLAQGAPREVGRAITERWKASEELLGLTSAHPEDLRMTYPLSRMRTPIHFQAARRNGPQYEPFMTVGALELAFRIPIEFKQSERGAGSLADHLFREEYRRFRGIPTNPASNSMVRYVLNWWRKVDPDVLKHSGAWSTIQDPFNEEEMAHRFADSIKQAQHRLNLNMPRRPSPELKLACYQVACAARVLTQSTY